MSLNIVGISAHFHDSAVCVLKEGELIAAAEEERFSRIKHDSSIPKQALRYCLEAANLNLADVDCIAYYEDPYKKFARQLATGPTQITLEDWYYLDPQKPERDIREILGYDGALNFVEHHQSHAAASFYYSGFDEAAICTVDGVGEWATTTYMQADQKHFNVIDEVDFPHSLGLLYSTITGYLGFRVNGGEYKVMGLAPYGKPIYLDKMRSLVHSDVNTGQYRLNMEFFDFLSKHRMYSDQLIELFEEKPREAESELLSFHKDIARSLQVFLEEMLFQKINYLHKETQLKNLCMGGGVALNCVANGKILRKGPFDKLFVQPAANDAGNALGAAILTYRKLSSSVPNKSTKTLKHVYLGPSFTSTEIHADLTQMPIEYQDYRGDEPKLINTVAEKLADNKVIGWFQGRMEFGPRALGARSILGDPRDPNMRRRINLLVKKREDFRPFAPVVLEDKMSEHFDLDRPSPFMLDVCQVTSPLDLPAITHIDNSARVQTVSEAINYRYAALLRAFDALTACPILLNTSFNMRGEPIVCTPLDAIKCFVLSQLDYLVLEDFLISKESIPESWKTSLSYISRPRSNISHSVYTLF